MAREKLEPLTLIERIAQYLPKRFLGRVAHVALKLRGVEIPARIPLGNGLRLPHGAVGLVVHPYTRIGRNVKLYQGVTLGRSDTYLPQSATRPGGGIIIRDRVLIGANAVVLFKSGQTLEIGEGSVVGAGSVVITDIPPNEIWAGTPAKLVRQIHETNGGLH